MKLSSPILKLTNMLNNSKLKTALIPFVGKIRCAQRKKLINRSTSFAIDNKHYVSFRIREQESVPWCGGIQNFEDQTFLGRLSIFTPIPLDAQDVWSLNW